MQNYTLQADSPEFDLKGNPHWFTVPADRLQIATLKPWDLTFQWGGKTVLTITEGGKLIIAEDSCAKEAAEALYEAWQATLGRYITK